MLINFFKIRNFRRLKNVFLETNEGMITAFVGANNSGKSSALIAIKTFLTADRKLLKISDFSIPCLKLIRSFFIAYETQCTMEQFNDCLPSVEVGISYETEKNSLEGPIANLFVPHLDFPEGTKFNRSIRIKLRIDENGFNLLKKDCQTILQQYGNKTADSESSYDKDPSDDGHLLKHVYDLPISRYFSFEGKHVNTLELDSSKSITKSVQKLKHEPLDSNTNQDEIPKNSLTKESPESTKEVTEDTRDIANLQETLKQHFKITFIPNLSRLEAFNNNFGNIRGLRDTVFRENNNSYTPTELNDLTKDAVRSQAYANNEWSKYFKNFYSEINENFAAKAQFNADVSYPQFGAFFNAFKPPVPDFVCWFPSPLDTGIVLPESNQGLGTRNISALQIFLSNAVREWKEIRTYMAGDEVVSPKAFCHLVLIEEPESNLNATLEGKIPKIIQTTLEPDAVSKTNLSETTYNLYRTKVLVTTHSLEFTRKISPKQIAYFKRLTDLQPSISNLGEVGKSRITEVVNFSSLTVEKLDKLDLEKLLTQWGFLDYYQVLFCDGVVLFEGITEHTLIKPLLERKIATASNTESDTYKRIASLLDRQITWTYAKGKAFNFIKPLLEELNIPTLIVTDIDFELNLPKGSKEKGIPTPRERIKQDVVLVKERKDPTFCQYYWKESYIKSCTSSNSTLTALLQVKKPNVEAIVKKLAGGYIERSVIYATQEWITLKCDDSGVYTVEEPNQVEPDVQARCSNNETPQTEANQGQKLFNYRSSQELPRSFEESMVLTNLNIFKHIDRYVEVEDDEISKLAKAFKLLREAPPSFSLIQPLIWHGINATAFSKTLFASTLKQKDIDLDPPRYILNGLLKLEHMIESHQKEEHGHE